MIIINRSIALLATVGALALSASPVAAQAKEKAVPAKHETQAQLQKEAKTSMADAKATALKLVPAGKIKSSELERENGKLIYSFDIATKGKSGIDEVNVDAVTGTVIGGVVHENAAAEAKEAKAEAKEKKAEKKAEMKAEMKKP